MKTRNVTLKNMQLMTCCIFFVLGFVSCKSGDKNPGLHRDSGKQEIQAPKTDIHAAALMGDLKAIKMHIAAGTDLEKKDPLGGSTPLITACVFGKSEVAIALIEAGANVDAKNNDGSTPLHCAALFCYTDIVRSLLEHGADKSLTNNNGELAIRAVEVPFEKMIPIYDFFSRELGPLGLRLDYDYLEEQRPGIAALLK